MNTNNPVYNEVKKNIETFNLKVVVEQDMETLELFKEIKGLVAFKTTLFKEGQILGVGRGTATLNRMNKFIERGIRYAYTSSLIDAIVRATKTLDSLYLITDNTKINSKIEKEVDLEKRDEQVFFNDEDLPQYATEKQKNFLLKLVNEKCSEDTKQEYLEQIHSPYFSRFEASELISSLLPSHD